MSKKSFKPMLTSRFALALSFANAIHNEQIRKSHDGSEVPYVSHLMAVSATVLEYGGTETEAIAALLHDSAEDQGGMPMLETVRAMFGEDVATIVAGCTDSYDEVKSDWKARKEAYIAHLSKASASVKLVAGSDKLHNLNCTIRDLRGNPPAAYWKKFTAGVAGKYWYFKECGKALKGSPVAKEYAIRFAEFEQILRQRREL